MGKAASNQKRGWEQFTDAIIRLVNQKNEPVVFLLWGSYAQRKAEFVDHTRHLVLKAAHPSPLSAHNGFLGARSEEHTSELQSLMRISYAVFCLKKKTVTSELLKKT